VETDIADAGAPSAVGLGIDTARTVFQAEARIARSDRQPFDITAIAWG
jgi:hypothetical protein